MTWNFILPLAFCVSAGFTFRVIPKILSISFEKHLFDEQNERKIHNGVIPRLGGFAFFPAILFTFTLLIGVNIICKGYLAEVSKDFFPEALLGLCSLTLLFLVGIADDLTGVSFQYKFLIQIFCAGLLISTGLWIHNLHGLFGIYTLHPIAGIPLTIFIIVFITNSINLIDGIDGLASGLSILALLFFNFIFILQDQWLYKLLILTTLGVLIAFFYFNVFGNANQRRKIFMGDTGSLTIGFILSFLVIKLCNSSDTQFFQSSNPIIIAFSPLLVPLLDVLQVIIHRIYTKKHIFKPDRNHIHHKFLSLGYSSRKALLMILLLSGLLTTGNILLSFYQNINLLLVTDIVLWAILHLWISRKIKKNSSKK